MTAPSSVQRVGALVGGAYQLQRLIAEGGMGAVYEATHTPSGHRCAVKMLRPDRIHDPWAVERFVREARALSGAAHPNVVQLWDTGYHGDGAPFLVMNYLEGDTLAARLEARGRFSQEETLPLLGPILAALHASHGKGIIHRDVKPENVFLARDAQGYEHPILIDYGVAGFSNEPEDQTTFDQRKELAGTLGYMSPEQVAGTAAADPSADVYSAGVMLYELLTGAQPYQRENAQATMNAILHEAVRSPSRIVPTISPAMEATVLCAMARDPAHRFPSCEVLHAAIHDALQQPAGSPALRQYPLAERVIAARGAGEGSKKTGAEFADKRARTVMIVLNQGEARVADAPSAAQAVGFAPAASPAPPAAKRNPLPLVAAVLLFVGGLGMLAFALFTRLRRG